MAKLDKLPVHVYEVDEEADKDEVGFLSVPALFSLETDCTGFEGRAELEAQQEVGCLVKQRKSCFFKCTFGLT